MQKLSVAGLNIDFGTKKELLEVLLKRINQKQKTWLTTPYSEFLYAGLKNPEMMQILNKADISVPDGVGIFWAKKFLEISLLNSPPFSKGRGGGGLYLLTILQALWQIAYSLLAILFNPKWIYKNPFPPPLMQRGGDATALVPPSLSKEGVGGVEFFEKIPGSDLVWDIAKMANDNNLSIFLLGGFGNTAELASCKLQAISNKLKIAGTSNKNPNDPSVYEDIKKASPDILLVAYGPLKQEAWIAQNLPNLPVKLVIGVGGTFDYLAKKRLNPPKFLRQIGLEWLFRLFTQPFRVKRILKATLGLINLLWHYKVFNQYPMRKNVVSIILNESNDIFIAKKSHNYVKIKQFGSFVEKKWKNNYWQFPQGGVGENENIQSAAERELKEETGIQNLTYLMNSEKKYSYLYVNSERPFWRNLDCPYKGQDQSIVYFKFAGKKKEINFPLGEEFEAYKWVNHEELANSVHKDKLPLAKIVLDDLKEMQEKGILDK